MIKRALISVSDKTGLLELGKALKHFQVEIISTGGTARVLEEGGVPTKSVSDYTGFPEMMEGRLKTLHPRVHGALLGKRDEASHQESAETYGIEWIDLLVVNLYPFEKVATQTANPEWSELIENIDIGGPAMIRSAAKNHDSVLVVVDPKDYKSLIQKMKMKGSDGLKADYRLSLAQKAFRHTATYDSLIAQTLSSYEMDSEGQRTKTEFPRFHFVHGKRLQQLRYGENPHQKAAVYRLDQPKEYKPLSTSLQGKELSFNNHLDADAAWKLILELPPKTCAILKHNNPCGVALGSTEAESYQRALSSDPESAFGGIVAVSGKVDAELAEKMSEHFFEIICAEDFSVEAREVFQKKKNLRLLLMPSAQDLATENWPQWDFRSLSGTYVLQSYDRIGRYGEFSPDVKCVTEKEPSEKEREALRFAWVVGKNVKSNSIVLANDEQTLGIGCGEVNRKFASKSAAQRAALFNVPWKVCASDGFFPFPDSLEILKEAGVSSIVQPGGSIKDQDVIDACNKMGISMLFTKVRHFRH